MKNNDESRLLRFLYHTIPGRMVLKVLTMPALSRLVGKYLDSAISGFHIRGFINKNGIDMSEYEKPEYSCFNDCFTRKILPEKRPICSDEDVLISPCDARLSAYRIDENSVFHIKRSTYQVKDLIPDSRYAPDYTGGICLVFRLCVDDYHRYANIDNGKILENKEVSGRLHTVRPIAVNRYPVFTQNSREYTIIETEHFGVLAQIEVGAMMIGRIKNHQKSGIVVRGTEKGMFMYGGSTIVVLLERNKVEIPEEYFENTKNDIETRVLYGSKIGMKIN